MVVMLSGRGEKTIVAVLLVGFSLLALTAASGKSPTRLECSELAVGRAILAGDGGAGRSLTHLSQIWSALPLLGSAMRTPPFGGELLLCRSMTAALATALGAFVWLASRRFFGPIGGLISLGLYVFCPMMLAHGALATPDVARALVWLVAAGLLWRWADCADAPWARVGSIAAACLLAAGPLMLAMDRPASPDPVGALVFMNGQWFRQTPLTFHLYAFLIKTPLTFFVLVAFAGLGLLTRENRPRLNVRHALAIAGLLAAVVVCIHFGSTPPGHRDVLAIYPPLFIFAGGAAVWLRRKEGRFVMVLIVIALAGLVAESMWIRPDYLAYFNVLAGGPENGHKRLVDSSLDWGQDLPALKAFTDEFNIGKPRREALFVSYFGGVDPRDYGVDCVSLPAHESAFSPSRQMLVYPSGFYCISATYLMSTRGPYAGPWTKERERAFWGALAIASSLGPSDGEEPWRRQTLAELEGLKFARLCAYLRERGPDAVVGYSIMVYFIQPEEIDRAQFGPIATIHGNLQTLAER